MGGRPSPVHAPPTVAFDDVQYGYVPALALCPTLSLSLSVSLSLSLSPKSMSRRAPFAPSTRTFLPALRALKWTVSLLYLYSTHSCKYPTVSPTRPFVFSVSRSPCIHYRTPTSLNDGSHLELGELGLFVDRYVRELITVVADESAIPAQHVIPSLCIATVPLLERRFVSHEISNANAIAKALG